MMACFGVSGSVRLEAHFLEEPVRKDVAAKTRASDVVPERVGIKRRLVQSGSLADRLRCPLPGLKD
jgi:hypothetical protein